MIGAIELLNRLLNVSCNSVNRMSASQVENVSTVTHNNLDATKKLIPKKTMLSGERRTLQTIQLSSDESRLTRPGEHKAKDGKKDPAKIFPSQRRPVKVFVDPEPPAEKQSLHSTDGSTECPCNCHEKSEDNDLINFMTKETGSDEWKDLAEDRRQALEETLIENQQLHFEVSDFKSQVLTLKEEVSDCHDENRRLSQQRDYFASILQKLVDEDNENSDSVDDGQSADPTPGGDDGATARSTLTSDTEEDTTS